MKKGSKITNKKTKKKWSEIFWNSVALVSIGGVFVWAFATIYNDSNSEEEFKDQYLASMPSLMDTIPHSKVCMVDNIFQGDFPSVPVSIHNQTYYGCSKKALTDLTTIDSLRFAVDPISRAKVNKAIAIVAIHPDKDGRVMYFGSMETYNRYLKALDQQPKTEVK